MPARAAPRDNSRDVLTVLDVARELRIGKNAAYALINAGKIRAGRVTKNTVRISRSELERFLRGEEPQEG